MNVPFIWNSVAYDVALITDPTGKPIDRGIRETVTALCCLGFRTTMSCEGHEFRAGMYPYVTISPLSLKKKASELSEKERPKIIEDALHTCLQIDELLGEFYENRSAVWDTRLHVRKQPTNATLLSTGAKYLWRPLEKTGVWDRARSLDRAMLYKEEMSYFTHFLKRKIPSAPL